MEKSRIDWVIKINTMIIDDDQIKPQIFSLKNGKEIHSTFFAYNNGLVHGTNVEGKNFKFNIKELTGIKPLENCPPDTRRKANPDNKDETDSTGENTNFETARSTTEIDLELNSVHAPEETDL